MYQVLQDQLNRAKEDYKKFTDWHQEDVPPLMVGNQVWLSTQHHPLAQPSHKLDHQFLGFLVEAVISLVAYRLTLPARLQIHPVFQHTLLVPAVPASSHCTLELLPEPVLMQRLPEYELAHIADSHVCQGHMHYLEDMSWEDTKAFHAPQLVHQFHQQYLEKHEL